METYKTSKCFKFTEQDIYNEGCVPETSQSQEVPIDFTGNSIGDVLSQIKNFFGVDDDAVELNSCDEIGRVDVFILETDNSEKAESKEIASWKKGKMRLWDSIYTFYVYKSIPVSL